MKVLHDPPAHAHLAQLITSALDLADTMGLGTVALPLNEALERLTGRGIVPPAMVLALMGDDS